MSTDTDTADDDTEDEPEITPTEALAFEEDSRQGRLASYRAGTERIAVLADFMQKAARLPLLADGECSDDAVAAYDIAVVAALQAVARIADESP